MEYIPDAEDFGPQEITAIAFGELDQAADMIGVAKEKLIRLMRSDSEVAELVESAIAEYETATRLKLMLMVPEALDTLAQVMRDQGSEKTASARVKAADSVLSRTFLPPLKPGSTTDTAVTPPERVLPSLGDIVPEGAEADDVLAIARKHRQVLDDIEALQRGATQIIDGVAATGSAK